MGLLSRVPVLCTFASLLAATGSPPALAGAPEVACEHGVCFRFPGEAVDYFKFSASGLNGPYHKDNGCEGIDGPCYCTSYWGADFDHCYGGHKGTDYMLDGAFRTMAQDIAVIVPADAEVFAVDDTHYDRCHFSPRDLLFDPTHDGRYCGWEYNAETGQIEEREVVNNYIILRHWNGRYFVYSRILHIKQDSVPGWIKAALADGQTPRVSCGEPIAYVGSAGKSYAPHIHFEVRTWGPIDTFGTYTLDGQSPPAIDPYCGPYVTEAGRTSTMWTSLPAPEAGSDAPYGLPGLSCQAPYDPEAFPSLPARCLEEGLDR